MKLLVTGARGFIGKNLCAHLKNRSDVDLFEYTKDLGWELLDQYTAECDFVFHLAGINRPKDTKSFAGNYTFTAELLQGLKRQGNKAPILLTSSIQAELDNPYGISKKKAEALLLNYASETGVKVFIYRLPNVFGKWCKPNYNSVVATFCDGIANGRPINIDNPDAAVSLVYIDDVVEEFLAALDNRINKQSGICQLKKVHGLKVGALADLIASFKESRNNLMIGNMGDILTKQLYSTYLSYLAEDAFNYPLTVHADNRGYFAEFIKTANSGQVSINVVKPGITKGNHWHHTKTEKMLVASGSGIIRFQKVQGGDVFLYPVNGDKPEVIDIPVGYTHSITNTGSRDMVLVIWVNEIFNPQSPDTYPMEIDLRPD